jgi:hypothetical protein
MPNRNPVKVIRKNPENQLPTRPEWKPDPETRRELLETIAKATEAAKQILKNSRPTEEQLDEPFTI